MSLGISSIRSINLDPTAIYKKLDSGSDGSVNKEEFFANINKQVGEVTIHVKLAYILKQIEENVN